MTTPEAAPRHPPGGRHQFSSDVEAEQDPLQMFSYAARLSPQIADLASGS
jgi:hypothetical protein